MNRILQQARNATAEGKSVQKYRQYKRYDVEHGFNGDDTISAEEIKTLCFSENSKCEYCGSTVDLGVDRKSNALGHTKENAVCSCRKCNIARGDNFTYEDFKEITSKYKILNNTFMTSRLTEVKTIDELSCLKFSPKNRAINPKHVQEIAKSMIKNGYRILDNTIFVDAKTLVVLRGQHRVAAALDVYAKTGELVPLEIVFKDMDGDQEISNYVMGEEINRKNWDISDFVSSYRGTLEYEKLIKFMDDNGVNDYKYLMHVLRGINKKSLAAGLDVSDIPTGQMIIDFIKSAYGLNAFDKTNEEALVHARNLFTALRYFFEGETKTSNRQDALKKVRMINNYMENRGHTLFDYAPYFKKWVSKGINDFMAKHDMKVPNAENIVDIILNCIEDMNKCLLKDQAKAEENEKKLSVKKKPIVAE